jgi:hypothetical protein
VDYCGGNDGNTYKTVGRNNALNGVDREQYTNTCTSTFDSDQSWYLGTAKNVGGI